MTLEQIVNYPLLHKLTVDRFLKQQRSFKDIFLKKFPELVADVNSLLTVPNCSCKDKVEVFIHKNRQAVGELVFNFIKENNLDINLNSFINEFNKSTYLSGTIIETTIDRWKSLSNKLREDGSIFRGFSVVLKEDNKILVFFL